MERGLYMVKYTIKKLLTLIPKMLAISLILFMALEALPGDALSRSVDPQLYAEMTEAQREERREVLGLNDPTAVRYFRWLTGILKGDFGYSTSTGQSIGKMLAGRLPYTMELAFYGLALATILGIILGFLAAIKKNTIIDYLCTTISVCGVSLPEFFFGIVWLTVFVLTLHWFPSGGRMPVGDDSFVARIPYMVLPISVMAISMTSNLVRYTRSSMLDVLSKDYIKTARSKGMSEVKVNFKHAFRNALIPIMTMIIGRLPVLVGGSIVIETVFNYAGIGSMAMEALTAGDIPVVMVTTMATAVLVLLASTLIDLVTGLLDPRVRFE